MNILLRLCKVLVFFVQTREILQPNKFLGVATLTKLIFGPLLSEYHLLNFLQSENGYNFKDRRVISTGKFNYKKKKTSNIILLTSVIYPKANESSLKYYTITRSIENDLYIFVLNCTHTRTRKCAHNPRRFRMGTAYARVCANNNHNNKDDDSGDTNIVGPSRRPAAAQRYRRGRVRDRHTRALRTLRSAATPREARKRRIELDNWKIATGAKE